MKRIVVIGSGGQDGRILVERLRGEGNHVLGVERTRLVAGGVFAADLPARLDITDPDQVNRVLTAVEPDELYYLAAHHHSSEELGENLLELFRRSEEVHVTGLLNVLDTMRRSAPSCRTFYAASSHVFGSPPTPVQDESTPLEPRCIYGITKTAGVHLCRFYRERHDLHVSVGILYNHESPYRARKFVSQRIVQGALEAQAAKRAGQVKKLELGNLSAVVDWGYAPDYMDAVIRMLARDVPDDFVVATGVAHTVGDFVASAFGHVGLDWQEYVEQKPGLVRRPSATLIGNPAKLQRATGWQPSISFEEMVGILLRDAS